MRRALPPTAIALAAALALAAPAAAATQLAFEVTNHNTDGHAWWKGFDPPATAFADFDGDGHAELVGHNENQKAYVLSTREPKVLAEISPPYPPYWGARPLTSPVIRDVNANGQLDVVLTTSAGTTCVYEFVPHGSTRDRFIFRELWCHRADWYDGAQGTAIDGTPAVEDVTGDGKAEIFVNTEERGLFAYNHDGTVRWSIDAWGGNAGPTVADLDKDGRKEVLFFGDGGEVRAVDAQDGWIKWEFWAGGHVTPASITVGGAAGDLDGDGLDEVVFTARQAKHDNESEYHKNHLALFVLDHNGGVQWWTSPAWANPMSYTHPVIADLNGDGQKDLLLQDWNTIGHKPGKWEVMGPANVFAYDAWGNLMWRQEIDNSWSNDDVPLADVDGDGKLEVLAIGFGPGGDGVWYLDAATGEKEEFVSHAGWIALRGAAVGDFDGDGKTEWAISVNTGDRGGGYRVYQTDSACWVEYGGWQNENPCGHPAGARPKDAPRDWWSAAGGPRPAQYEGPPRASFFVDGGWWEVPRHPARWSDVGHVAVDTAGHGWAKRVVAR